MKSILTISLFVFGLVLLPAMTPAAPGCDKAVRDARSMYKTVGIKVIKMRRMHQVKKMMSMNEMKNLDAELKAVQTLIQDASDLCTGNKESASIAKASLAIEKAKIINEKHIEMMKQS